MKKKRGIIVSIIVVIVICIIGYGVYSYEAGKSEVKNTSNKSQDYTNEVNSNKNTTEKDNKDYSNKETNNKNNTSSKEDSNQKNVSSNSKNVTQLNNKSSKSSNTQKSESSNNQIKKLVNNNDTSSNSNSNNNNNEAYEKRLKALSGKYQDMESDLINKYGHNKYGLITPGPGPETIKLETSYYNDWNNVLNSVWRDLEANLPESQMKNLTKQEVEWINSKKGKDIGEQGQMTRDRAVYLLKKYIYQIS
ncbi:hypothetical protein HMPREF1092_00363 [Clostridium thermobutyricum]|uniref:Lysozyme inhibitor LprI N-terminal domain-containing protein n=1 Tax=Clostridium thermobutyricum TaxID=29372 RepID=N9Y5X6_9CLOT|nr:hypothetical protein [Clostridium thermobutyricum]ENZ03177.1 hypothetical protein HMPREF1092_00363 [Clostridium thermobutyricum]